MLNILSFTLFLQRRNQNSDSGRRREIKLYCLLTILSSDNRSRERKHEETDCCVNKRLKLSLSKMFVSLHVV